MSIEDNLFDGLSDEEMVKLRLLQISPDAPLAKKIDAEIERRTSSYRGPGIYEIRGDQVTAYATAARADGEEDEIFVIFGRPESMEPKADYTVLSLDFVNGVEDGSRRFRYVEPLEEGQASLHSMLAESSSNGSALEEEVEKEKAPPNVAVGAIWYKGRTGEPGGPAVITELCYDDKGNGSVLLDRSWRHPDGTPWNGPKGKVAFKTLNPSHYWKFVGFANEIHNARGWVLEQIGLAPCTRAELISRSQDLIFKGRKLDKQNIHSSVNTYVADGYVDETPDGVLSVSSKGSEELEVRRHLVEILRQAYSPLTLDSMRRHLLVDYHIDTSEERIANSLYSIERSRYIRRSGVRDGQQTWSLQEES